MTPIANAESNKIGSVDFVSPDEIKVLLDIDAPNDVALNTGTPRPFPRINSYVLIPGESGFLVAQIEWITIERSQFPKRRGMQDFGIIDLPYPLRKMSLNPIGVLREIIAEDDCDINYKFSRGIEIFPTVGDPVLIPSQTQLKAIVESGDNRRVNIGISPLAGNAVVSIDPDRLFGRHLAVLGNTGSGKSCSVAGLMRWSIEASKCQRDKGSNARFIILDPNGEYSTAFDGLNTEIRKYGAVCMPKSGIKQLEIPIWLWNAAEWVAFAQASVKTQKPTLIQALRLARDKSFDISPPPQIAMRKFLQILIIQNQGVIDSGDYIVGGGKTRGYLESLNVWLDGIKTNDSFSCSENEAVQKLLIAFDNVFKSNKSNNKEWPKYSLSAVTDLQDALLATFQVFGGNDVDLLPVDENIPVPFSSETFLQCLEATAGIMKTTEYVETMLIRIKSLLGDSKLKSIISPVGELSLEKWLSDYIVPNNSSSGAITIIDLSLIPSELTFIIASVFARLTLESLQRYRKCNNGKTLPTVLVMEEAHTFIKRYNDDSDNENAICLCSRMFEKIAREGRKYGLGLVLSSQRPSELSPTVLSQCNSFLLHRLSNDRDQELVSRLVPDNLRGLLSELPSLPPRNAILLGWASELPVLVQMKYLEENYRPKSDDPDYWDNWINPNSAVNWGEIAADWKGEKKEKEEDSL